VVAETFNMARLAGYTTGGTLHLIANNQVGFTTEPSEGRSTDYSSDLAKGFDAPIIHVNADDPEACLAAARLAGMYRQRFHGDVVIDLVGYRRYGHNEGDEPAYTQPLMAAAIAAHPSVRELYRAILVEAGVISVEEADVLATAAAKSLATHQATVRRKHAEPQLDRGEEAISPEEAPEPVTAVDAATLRTLNVALMATPPGFSLNPKLVTARPSLTAFDEEPRISGRMPRRSPSPPADRRPPDPPHRPGHVRGTFSQRHLALHDAQTGALHVPIQHLPGARASFELHNSPLSEAACLGFEYGYAATAPEALVLWEAQYGDFVNGAEIIVDQFIIAGLAKWRQTSRLTLLLPHGYEGQGPEHSSARLERFLALGAEGNIRVVYPTTPAQYFHLLRRQARHGDLRPMVVMAPKSLLRLPQAASSLADLTAGAFASVLDDPTVAAPDAVRRVILCSGKLYYDLAASPSADSGPTSRSCAASAYPFPTEGWRWCWPVTAWNAWWGGAAEHGARKLCCQDPPPRPVPDPAGDVSRPERSRPAEGYPAAHRVEQARIVREALTS
jgi:2-oxoglutarate dehydrogenase E1 component